MELNFGEILIIKVLIWLMAIAGWVIIFKFIFKVTKLIFKNLTHYISED